MVSRNSGEDVVLTSWYVWGVDNCSIYVLVLRLSRVAEQKPGIRVGCGES